MTVVIPRRDQSANHCRTRKHFAYSTCSAINSGQEHGAWHRLLREFSTCERSLLTLRQPPYSNLLATCALPYVLQEERHNWMAQAGCTVGSCSPGRKAASRFLTRARQQELMPRTAPGQSTSGSERKCSHLWGHLHITRASADIMTSLPSPRALKCLPGLFTLVQLITTG